jgi:FixJ family two-component response regulator
MKQKKLLYCDNSPERQASYLAFAKELGLETMPSPDENHWPQLKGNADSLAAMIIGPDVLLDEALRLIEFIRLSPFHASLPIALIMAERDLDVARQAMDTGVTEIFLENDLALLRDFIADSVHTLSLPSLSGKALVVEDDQIFADYVSNLCKSLGFEVHLRESVEQAIEALQIESYQIVITDVVLRGTKSGLSLLRHIHQMHGKNLPVIVMSGFDDLPRRLMALRNGVGDFISKPFAGEEFIWRVQRTMQFLALNDGLLQGHGRDHRDFSRNDIAQVLSPREFEIFNAIVKGKSDKEIASSLGISYWTVRTHVQQIFAKTGAINRRELMARYISAAATSRP